MLFNEPVRNINFVSDRVNVTTACAPYTSYHFSFIPILTTSDTSYVHSFVAVPIIYTSPGIPFTSLNVVPPYLLHRSLGLEDPKFLIGLEDEMYKLLHTLGTSSNLSTIVENVG